MNIMIVLSWMISIFSIVKSESINVESYGDSLIQVSSQQINGDVTKVYTVVGSQLQLFCTRSQQFEICGWKPEKENKFCNVLYPFTRSYQESKSGTKFCPNNERLEVQNADGYKCSLWIHGVGVQDSVEWSCSTKHDPMDTNPPLITQFQLEVISPFQIELLSEQINSSLDGGGAWQEHELTCRGEGQGSVIPQIIWSTDDDNLIISPDHTTTIKNEENNYSLVESSIRINMTDKYTYHKLEVRCLLRQIHPLTDQVVFESSKSKFVTKMSLKSESMMTNIILIPICIILAFIVIVALFIRQKYPDCISGSYGTYKTSEKQNLVIKDKFKKSLLMVNIKKKGDTKEKRSPDENETRPRIINEQIVDSSSRLEEHLDQPVILLSTQNPEETGVDTIDRAKNISIKQDYSPGMVNSTTSTLSRSGSLKRKHLVTITQGSGQYVRMVKINTPSNSPLIHTKANCPLNPHSPMALTFSSSPGTQHTIRHPSPGGLFHLGFSVHEHSPLIHIEDHTQQVHIEQYNPDVNSQQNQPEIENGHLSSTQQSSIINIDETKSAEVNYFVTKESDLSKNRDMIKEKIETEF